MSLKYHLVQRKNPRVPTDPPKHYASVTQRNKISLRMLSNEIAQISTVSSVDTLAVIESLLTLLPKHLIEGDIVRLGDFGAFKVNLQSGGAETEEDFNNGFIKGVKLGFRPGRELKKALDDATFEKVS